VQVKLFWINAPLRDKGLVVHDRAGNAAEFEASINAWLSKNPGVQIKHVEQSACGGSLGPALWLVSVWYSQGEH